MLAIMVPPFDLPTISSSRGEIRKTLSSCLDDAARQAANDKGRWTFQPCRGSISPLEEEMVGRSKGGITASNRGGLQ
jgi:hypothetical protein